MQTAARLGLRSEASARFERGVDPYGIVRAIARFAELLHETCPDLVVHSGVADVRGEALPPPERFADVRITQVNRILGTALRADELAGSPRSDRVHGLGRWRHASGRAAVVAARQRGRDRRRRGGGAPLRLRADRQDGAQVDRARTAVGDAAPAPPTPRRAARARHLRGDAEPVPRARHAGQGGSRQRGADDQQPARRRGERAADLAPTRTAARDRVQRVASPTRRRVVRDRPRLPAGRR